MKIGKGHSNSHPSEEKSRKQLIQEAARFEKSLEDYLKATIEEREILADKLLRQVGAIHAAAEGLQRSGLHKQTVRVESDYKRYMKDPSEENYTTLLQELSTLREYGRLPTPNQERGEHTAKKNLPF